MCNILLAIKKARSNFFYLTRVHALLLLPALGLPGLKSTAAIDIVEKGGAKF